MRLLALALTAASLAGAGAASAAIRIHEVRVDAQPVTGAIHYFELRGTPGESLTGLTYIVIGDGGAVPLGGVIEEVEALSGTINAQGRYLVAEAGNPWTTGADAIRSLNFENSDNVTHLLVRGFTGSDGLDLDTNDDCVLDETPWAEVVDVVAIVEELVPITTECHYGPPTVGPDGASAPMHVYRCEDTGEWRIGESHLSQSEDTPGQANPVCATGVGAPVGALAGLEVAPNPVTRIATIRYRVEAAAGAASRVRLELFDLAGRRRAALADGPATAGEHRLEFDFGAVPGLGPGLYLLRMDAAGRTTTRRILVRP